MPLTINYNFLQGSVTTYLRCGGVVNNQIKKGLLLSLWVTKFKTAEYFAKPQATATSHILCTSGQHTAKNKGIFQWKDLISVWQNYGHECGPTFLAHPVRLIAGQFKMMYSTRCASKRFYYDFR